MSRFVIRYVGKGLAPKTISERIRLLPDAKVIDQSTRMLLVEADAAVLNPIFDGQEDWLLVPECQVSLPDVRPRSKRRTSD